MPGSARSRSSSCIALAISTKYNGGLILLFVLLYFGLIPLLYVPGWLSFSRRQKKIVALSLAVIICIVPSVFYVLNPQFYSQPAQTLMDTVSFWQKQYSPQSLSRNPRYTTYFSLKQKFKAANKFVLHRWASLNRYLGLSPSLEAVLFALGLLLGLINGFKILKRERYLADISVVTLWALVTLGINYAWVTASWGRFFLLIFSATPIFIAYGLWGICAGQIRLGQKPLPDLASARYVLGEAYEKDGRITRAVEEYGYAFRNGKFALSARAKTKLRKLGISPEDTGE